MADKIEDLKEFYLSRIKKIIKTDQQKEKFFSSAATSIENYNPVWLFTNKNTNRKQAEELFQKGLIDWAKEKNYIVQNEINDVILPQFNNEDQKVACREAILEFILDESILSLMFDYFSNNKKKQESLMKEFYGQPLKFKGNNISVYEMLKTVNDTINERKDPIQKEAMQIILTIRYRYINDIFLDMLKDDTDYFKDNPNKKSELLNEAEKCKAFLDKIYNSGLPSPSYIKYKENRLSPESEKGKFVNVWNSEVYMSTLDNNSMLPVSTSKKTITL